MAPGPAPARAVLSKSKLSGTKKSKEEPDAGSSPKAEHSGRSKQFQSNEKKHLDDEIQEERLA